MRLLHFADGGGGLRITEFIGASIPPYAILSHTWGADDEEVSYRDVVDAPVSTYKTKAGYKKLVICLMQAALDGLRYSWVDTCSIDRSSSAELSEAINSMFRWYQNAERCYVYLADITESKPDASITSSRWFTRGWTLQELLAPKSLEFYTAEGLPLGNKISRKNDIQLATNIPSEALDGNKSLAEFDFEQRFSWAEKRQTKREEDAAYCLLGLFDVHIPLIYGEGRQKAMKRLRREIAESMKELDGFSRLNTKDGSPSPSPMMNIRRKVTVESTQENEPSQGMDSAPLPPPRTNRSVMQASVMLVADPKLLKDTPVSQLPAELVGQKFVEEYYPNFRHNPGEQQEYYGEASHFVFQGATDTTLSAKGTEAIRKRIHEVNLEYKISSSNIVATSLNCQRFSDYFTILILGEMWNKAKSAQFVHNVVLRERHKKLAGKSIFILSDTFKFLKEPTW